MAKKKQFPLRLDPRVFDLVEQWANDELRSANSHIEYLLRDALKRAGRLKAEKPAVESEEQA
ncbi:MAG: toxin-antitoxin system HicB family antitoxin [Candidatus Melainabacteria bacterium HGW-Melainabacteria-1]|nr:MAG: toxin-antitoxin system HicB family antitoxin [Candidatus Melainabacteria bacterium HGW-Melainabacteria-1]